MWKIEISGNYTNVVNHLLYDTEEEAKKQRDILLPFIEKDHYDLASNGADKVVTLTDKCGIVDIVVKNVHMVRCYDANIWDDYAIEHNAKYNAAIDKAKADTNKKSE